MASFPTAAQAREQAQSYSVISVEVQAIETAIIAAIAANLFRATVTSGTFMTTAGDSTLVAEDYYNVWKGTVTNAVKTEQMTEIIKHFTNKGYSVERITDPVTGNTLNWQVDW